MELVRLIKAHQLEFIRIYHAEMAKKGVGIMVFRVVNDKAEVAYYPRGEIRSTYMLERLDAMVAELATGRETIEFKNRAVIQLPVFAQSAVELPDGVPVPQVMFMVLMDGATGRIFQAFPQVPASGEGWYYQMVSDPTPEELAAERAKAAEPTGEAPLQVQPESWWLHYEGIGKPYTHVCQVAASTPRYFNRFRSAKEYMDVIGGESEQDGERLAARLATVTGGLDIDFRDLKFVDDVGGPLSYYYTETGWELSPVCLRYVETYFMIARWCGGLDGRRIIELGAGYGGLCAVTCTLEPRIVDYACIELPACVPIVTKYLEEAGVTAGRALRPGGGLIAALGTPAEGERGPVVVSEYVLDQLSREGIDYYIGVMRECGAEECYVVCGDPDQSRRDYLESALRTVFNASSGAFNSTVTCTTVPGRDGSYVFAGRRTVGGV